MISIIFEIGFELVKKLYRFLGPAMILVILFIVGLIVIPNMADRNAYHDTAHSEINEIISFDEVRYDEETGDRVFRIRMRNTGADLSTFGMLYITNEDGKPIHNSIKTEFDGLKIGDRRAIISYIPPGTETTAEVWIDDFKLEGLDHIYVTDLYSEDNRGKRFEIEKK